MFIQTVPHIFNERFRSLSVRDVFKIFAEPHQHGNSENDTCNEKESLRNFPLAQQRCRIRKEGRNTRRISAEQKIDGKTDDLWYHQFT